MAPYVNDGCGDCKDWLCAACTPSTFGKLDFAESVMLHTLGGRLQDVRTAGRSVSLRFLRRAAELLARKDPAFTELVMEALDWAVQERQREQLGEAERQKVEALRSERKRTRRKRAAVRAAAEGKRR